VEQWGGVSMSMLDLFIDTFVSRKNDFALQRSDGGYVRAGRPLALQDVRAHLAGAHTIGSYVIDEHGNCRYAVFDADSADGLDRLHAVHCQLAAAGIPSYLEQSRRGGHLWVFLVEPVRASLIRAWLLPFCPAGIEFYPKQDEGRGYGSLMRLPLGVHRLSGKRYPFVVWEPSGMVPIATTIQAALVWLEGVEQTGMFAEGANTPTRTPLDTRQQEKSFSLSYSATPHLAPTLTIRAWCAQQDPYEVVGRYVALNSRGVGQCPFGWHHSDGHDSRDSFKVYAPGVSGGYCWYCYVWQQGGSVFDFLRYYYGLDARTLWQQLREGVMR
jgi:TOTE conflict system, Archaeo-Eukaryotic Primase domain